MSDLEPSPAQVSQRTLGACVAVGVIVWVVSGGSLCTAVTAACVAFAVSLAFAGKQKARDEFERRRLLELAPPPSPHVETAVSPGDRRDASLRPTRWPLGSPYRLTIVGLAAPGERADPAKRTAAVARFDEGRIVLVGAGDALAWDPPAAISYAQVEKVEFSAASAVLVCGSEAYALVPSSYADRERLEWELAVRLPAAVERGFAP